MFWAFFYFMLTIINQNKKDWVDARELHTVLEVQTDFSTWVKRFVVDYFTDGEDFSPKLGKSIGGRPSK